jgi:hypothetical protein
MKGRNVIVASRVGPGISEKNEEQVDVEVSTVVSYGTVLSAMDKEK